MSPLAPHLAPAFHGRLELIHPRRPWRTIDDVEYATFEYVDSFNHRRLHCQIGDQLPTELEALSRRG